MASANDEWIELHNPGAAPMDLSGWTLSDGGDINITLAGTLPGFGFFLLERTDETTIADLAADQIYTGALANGGETLELRDPSGGLIDSANADGGAWPAGDAGTRASMERRGGDDLPGNWGTFTGVGGVGVDSAGNPIPGTPTQPNSLFSATPTPTGSPTTSPTPPAGTSQPGSVLINEVAWAGSLASSSDEWIELHNPGAEPADLAGWTLSDGGDLNLTLSGSLPAFGFYLLERTDDGSVADIPADQIYSGTLANDGESLELRDASGGLIDSANGDGGGWPGGDADSRGSMERRGGDDRSGNWGTFNGYFGVGRDAAGNPIQGTPRGPNSLLFPTPSPTWIPGRVVINEVLIRPHYDWEGTGGVTTADEFIELHNLGPEPVYLSGWVLDDIAGGGSRPFIFPGWTISPGGYLPVFRSRTKIALNDSGDTVRLMAPDGRLIDEISYLRVRAANLSYGRLPDGSSRMAYGLWPTPGKANLPFIEPLPTRPPPLGSRCGDSALRMWLPRGAREPGLWRRLLAHGFYWCLEE